MRCNTLALVDRVLDRGITHGLRRSSLRRADCGAVGGRAAVAAVASTAAAVAAVAAAASTVAAVAASGAPTWMLQRGWHSPMRLHYARECLRRHLDLRM